MDRTSVFIVSGILLALACQWVCNLLSVATGIFSPWAWGRTARLAPQPDASKLKIPVGTGLLALAITVVSLFFACRCASELHRAGTRSEALVLGLTVWAGFLAVSIRSAGSDARASWTMSILGALLGVFREGWATAQTAALTEKDGVPPGAAGHSGADSGKDPAANVAAKVRQEFHDRNGLGFRDRLHGYLDRMHPKSPDRSEIESEADRLFADPEILESAQEGALQSRDRNRFREILAGRADIAAQENEQWVDAIHARWSKLVETGRGNGPAPSRSGALQAAAPQGNPAGNTKDTSVPGAYSLSGASGGPAAALPEASAKTGAPAAEEASSAFTARFQGFKEFLGAADRRELNPARLEDEVQILVAPPEEGYAAVERAIRELKREEMVKILRQRRDISRQEADSIADLIDSARARMVSRAEIREHRSQEATDRALAHIRDHVYSLQRPGVDFQGFQRDMARMLEESAMDPDAGTARVPEIPRETVLAEIASRKEFSRADADRLADTVEQAVSLVRENIERMEAETSRRVDAHRRTIVEQAEISRRNAMGAAWWLLGIALASAAASALGAWEGTRV